MRVRFQVRKIISSQEKRIKRRRKKLNKENKESFRRMKYLKTTIGECEVEETRTKKNYCSLRYVWQISGYEYNIKRRKEKKEIRD